MSVVSKQSGDKINLLFLRYCSWLARNPSLSKELELGIKLCSYLLVNLIDKGGTSDATHQIVYCLSDLVSFLNDFAISKAYPNARLPYGNNLKTWLTVVEYCEVCLELGAQRAWGTTGKWAAVCLVQAFKCLARSLLVVKRNEGLLPFPPIVPLRREALAEEDVVSFRRPEPVFRLGSGVVIRRIDSGPSFNQTQRPVEDFRRLVRGSSAYVFKGHALLGEVIYAVKPLIHLACMRLTGRNSWAQWSTSLALEAISLRLQWNDYSKKRYSEDQEWQYVSRLISLLVYMCRSPFYDRNVKFIILSVLYALRKIFPFLKFIIQPCIEFLPAWHETYFYLWSH